VIYRHLSEKKKHFCFYEFYRKKY